jgi:hypothetical protein
VELIFKRFEIYRVEPGYNDIGLCDTLPIASSVVSISSALLVVTLYSVVRTTLVYKDT